MIVIYFILMDYIFLEIISFMWMVLIGMYGMGIIIF